MILTTLMLSFTESSQLLFSLVTGLFVFLCITFLLPAIKRIRTLPPGPWGLPFVGYLSFIAKTDQYKDIDRLAKKFGPVFSVRLGRYDVIVVSDWKHLEKALDNDDLLDRPNNLSANPQAPSMLEMSGHLWKGHRQLFISSLRGVGLNESALEVKVKEEIENFIPSLANGPIELFPRILSTMSNNISNLLIGHGINYEDPMNKKLNEILITLGQASSLFHVFTESLPNFVKSDAFDNELKIPTILTSLTGFASYMEKEIEIHKKKGQTHSDKFNDYIDGYLVEQRKREKSNANDDVPFNLDILRQNLVSFYRAGTETIASTLSWAILCLVEHPEYCDRIRNEIEKVIGYERQPDYTDRLHMPLTMAFIYEVHRFASVVPINLIRRASKDTKIGIYNVPKDTLLLFNFFAIHRDPFLWINPDQFDPKRFLAEHDTKAVKPPFLVPFSGGRRVCPGEGLASVELFLYLVNIVRSYKIRLPPGTEISFEAEYDTVARPKFIPELIFEKLNPQKD